MNVTADRTRDQLSRRIDRARALASEQAATADLLTFYADLCGLQKTLLQHTDVVRTTNITDFASALNASAAAPLVAGVLQWLDGRPQQGLAGVTQAVRGRGCAEWEHLLDAYWRNGGVVAELDEVEQFVIESLLQPFAESVAFALRDVRPETADTVLEAGAGSRCAVCRGRPVAATLKERGHGARRSLVCGLCLTEWPTPRVVCPNCGEDNFNKLLVYRAEEFAAVRVDACSSCERYTKTIDLSVNGAAIHVVDDLATLALDLWAAGRGYRKMRPNLLRL